MRSHYFLAHGFLSPVVLQSRPILECIRHNYYTGYNRTLVYDYDLVEVRQQQQPSKLRLSNRPDGRAFSHENNDRKGMKPQHRMQAVEARDRSIITMQTSQSPKKEWAHGITKLRIAATSKSCRSPRILHSWPIAFWLTELELAPSVRLHASVLAYSGGPKQKSV